VSSRSRWRSFAGVSNPIFLCAVFPSRGCYTLKMTPDNELLRRYAETNSEEAFRELVQRHVHLVYSAALRQVNGDAHLAQDVAQTVFADLVRKAGSLRRRESLTGWLYTSAHFAAAKIVRTDHRRRDREDKFMREPIQETAPDADWENIRPLLDEAMHELRETDREAVLLRYFENRPFGEVGARLGLGENAARMRVERALEKLRGVLSKRGITTAAALASVISANAVQMAPANLAATLAAGSFSAAGAGTAGFTLLKIMTATQIKLGVGALVVAGATTALVVQHQTQEKLRAENRSLTQQVVRLQSNNQNLSNNALDAASLQSLSNEQMDELLKLRGDIALLKKENEAARSAARDAQADAKFVRESLEALAKVPPIKTFISTTYIRVSWNETLVAGGWQVPSGKRAFVFATVKPGQEGGQVSISSDVLEFTDAASARFGLNKFQVEGQTSHQVNKLTSAQYQTIRRAAQNSDGVEILASPSTSVKSGIHAVTERMETQSLPSGEQYSIGPVIDFMPTITEDGQFVQFLMVVQLNVLIPLPWNHQ
jgi:RNA polymerase sigma factor (sigma-70 family)